MFDLGRILLLYAGLLAAAVALGGVLERRRIPGLLAALFVGMAARLVLGPPPPADEPAGAAIATLAGIGVLWLLFMIGLDTDVEAMVRTGGDIVLLTVLNTAVPFLLGTGAALAFGYGLAVASFVGITRMPTAEAVVVPILEEFDMVTTRVGRFVIGAGVLDDVIEVVLVVVTSLWIGSRAAGETPAEELVSVAVGLASLLVLGTVAYRWLVPAAVQIGGRSPRGMMLVTVVAAFGFAGLAEATSVGLIVGALVAGAVMRPALDRPGHGSEAVRRTVDLMAFGFLGPIFFVAVGSSVDLVGLAEAPLLAVAFFLAAFVGKLVGAWLLTPLGRTTTPEAIAIGIGLNARLTTEIVVVRLLFGAGIIDERLFTALVAASGVSTLLVPPLFALALDRWGPSLRPQEAA